MRGKFVRMIAVDKVAQARTFPSRYYRNRLARDRYGNGIPPVFFVFSSINKGRAQRGQRFNPADL